MSSTSFREQLGILRSFAMYYGIPGRAKRMREFYAAFLAPGDLCFDIGSHLGNRLRVWDSLGARMVALEPQPQLMAWLRRLYGARPNVVLRGEAIGATPGTATLYISSRTPTVTTLSRDWIAAVKRDASFGKVAWDKPITVPVLTLDQLIAAHGLPAFCKIDVEGFELEVLRGLSQAIPALSFEYIPAAMHVAVGCIERLRELGTYEYNHAPGESHRLQEPRWLDPDAMLAVLARMTQGSGDVYARLIAS